MPGSKGMIMLVSCSRLMSMIMLYKHADSMQSMLLRDWHAPASMTGMLASMNGIVRDWHNPASMTGMPREHDWHAPRA